MLFYSDRLRFIFIHVIKTGGTSVREALAPHALWPGAPARPWMGRLRTRLGLTRLRERLGLTALPSRNERSKPGSLAALPAHASVADLAGLLPAETFRRYYKFAFVRNPWDWLVSWYHWNLRPSPDNDVYAVVCRMKGFEEYVNWRVEHGFHLQKQMVTGPDGEILVDFLGRFENLEEDFAHVCATLGVRAGLGHHNRSRRRDYRYYYTERTRELVAKFWAEDVAFFGYEFDQPASPYHTEWADEPTPAAHR